MKKRKLLSEQGTTIVEMALVFAIAGLFLFMGVKMYKSYHVTLLGRQLQDNVDQLFDAAAQYFQANCESGALAPNPLPILSPYSSSSGITYPPTATSYVAADVNNALVNNGFLSNWVPTNTLVDPSGGQSGYIVQFNPQVSATTMSTNACVVLNAGHACTPITPISTIPTSQAVIVTWTIQVAAKIINPNTIKDYAAVTSADCISGQTAGSSPATVDPCSSPNAAQNYLVWSRSASYARIGKGGSALGTGMQQLKSFTYEYTHDSNYELNQGYHTASPTQAPVYYVCGG